MTDRAEVRAALVAQRARVAPADIRRAGAAVARRLIDLPAVIAATRLGLYRPIRGEIDTDAIAQWAWRRGRRVYLPVTTPPRTMTFARWRAGDRFGQSRFGIDEPLPEARRIAPAGLDVVCVPVVAFDRTGTRLGHGAGYYDATFAFRVTTRRTKPLLVGLAYAFQEVAPLARRPWDVPLDVVVTDTEVVMCRAGVNC
jgi:5-formyltetrahydrofolate cyclo-ligase